MLSTDLIDWQLGPDGDIALGPGHGQDVQWTSGLPGILQGIRIAIQMVRGEWFLDDTDGVPYFERDGVPAADAILGQRFNELKAVAAFREAISRAPGVNQILSLACELDRATRRLRVTWAVRTTFGDTNPETTITVVGG